MEWFSGSQLRMNFLSESVIAVMRMGKTKDSKQLSSHLVQCSLFCELGCCSFYFILSNHYCLRAQVFCGKSCSVSCLILPFSHIHISVPATGQQLLKYAFGSSTKSFPEHSHSFVCSGSMCLSCVDICEACT